MSRYFHLAPGSWILQHCWTDGRFFLVASDSPAWVTGNANASDTCVWTRDQLDEQLRRGTRVYLRVDA